MIDTWNLLLGGFATALQPMNLMWAFVGCALGTAIGVLPGIGPALTVAMLLPVTAKVDPAGALIMLCGIYYGAAYGTEIWASGVFLVDGACVRYGVVGARCIDAARHGVARHGTRHWTRRHGLNRWHSALHSGRTRAD